jgi:dCMP deaminase
MAEDGLLKRIKRKTWDETFFAICNEWALRSTCLRRRYGCVAVRDKTVLSTGYNGAPRGLPHCLDLGCAREYAPSGTKHELCRATHAEQNAVANAARIGVSLFGATIYTQDVPCYLCAKILINAGIKEVRVLDKKYPDFDKSLDAFFNAGIPVLMKGERVRR